MECAFARRTTRWILQAIVALVLAQVLCGPTSVALADQTQPDPAGTATGDRSSAADAAGNPFVVPSPTDPSAPDYPKLKKDFDEFQAQAAREPLALKLADSVGHTRIATNFSWTLLDRIPGAFHASGICAVDGWIGAQEKCRAFDDVKFCGVCVCVSCLLCDRICVSVWRGGGECGSGKSGGGADLKSFSDWQRLVGIFGRQGIFSEWACVRREQ